MKKVFISYSHKDKDWVRDWLLPRLENAGIPVHIDFRDFEIGIASIVNMERAVEQCAKTILVFTPDWVKSVWCSFEGIMLQTEDPIGLKKKILPLMLVHCVLPPRLRIFHYADFRDKSNWDFQFNRLRKQIREDFAKVGPLKVVWTPIGDKDDYIAGLPQTGYELFGRQKELKILNEAWESEESNVLSFVAYGGVGKSTLVNKWLEKMRWDNYRGAEKVFGWSFYSQGTKERVTSADKFISEALVWFGDPDPKKGSPWDKGQRLADLIRRKKTLLILDGLEPLQSGLDFERGKIKDPALSTLITQLARKNNGLCVITTREEVAELLRFDKGVKQLNLDQISKEAGRALLRVGGVQGTDAELEAASEEFGNHALAIKLLSAYLQDIPGKHISAASSVGDLDFPEEEKHPRRVMEAFARRFGDSPELNVLHIMGLFYRPATAQEIKWLRTRPPVSHLTDRICTIPEQDWDRVINNLRHLELLAPQSHHELELRGKILVAHDNIHGIGTIDAHPMVRTHFGLRLQHIAGESWKEGHSHLYDYLALSTTRLPDTLEEMEPLFFAVQHGCFAGRHQETFDEVYWPRILRGGEHYITEKLCAFGAALSVVATFFELRWTVLPASLRKRAHSSLFNMAGLSLRVLGRLRDSRQPLQATLELTVRSEDWVNASIDSGNLSELYLILGDVEQALDYAQKSVDFAERSGNTYERSKQRCKLGNGRLQTGAFGVADNLFRKGEQLYKQRFPGSAYLSAMPGFWFCDLLLSQGHYREVVARATETIKIAQRNKWPLDIGLDNLSLGLAHLLQAANKEAANLVIAADFLDKALDGSRESGNQDRVPHFLLARAESYRYQQSWNKAWTDLEEAKEIAERGQMGLHMADYHLEAARLCLAQGERLEEAGAHYEEAAKRVQDMGYHRRDPEVLLIQAELELAEGKKAAARKTLKAAERRINEMGCHRWDIELERIKDSV